MTDTELQVLNTELTGDPEGLGYAGKTDPEMAALINAVNPGYSIDREAIDGQELQMAVVISEYVALTDVQRIGWQTILSAGSGIIAVSDARVKAQVAAIWGALTTTRANLEALQTRDASRAEVVFDTPGVSISVVDIAEALGRR